MLESLFHKTLGLRLQYKSFPVNVPIFLGTAFFIKHI